MLSSLASRFSAFLKHLQSQLYGDAQPSLQDQASLVAISFGGKMELDTLLPIGSRRAYNEQVATLISGVNAAAPLSLIMIDIDHFKSFNDLHGHKIGDKVLIEVAKSIERVAAGKGEAFRYGGEELVVLLPNHSLAEAASVAERARIAVAAIEISGVEHGVTASFGVATLPQTTLNAEELYEQADKAMYASKNNGRNRVTSADLLTTDLRAPKKPNHSLELFLEPRGIGGLSLDPRTPVRQFVLGLTNAGTALARYPSIRFERNCGLIVDPDGIDGNRNFGIPERPVERDWAEFRAGVDDVIHPGQTRKIAILFQRGENRGKGGTPLETPVSKLRGGSQTAWLFKPINFSCEISSEGFPTATVEEQISEFLHIQDQR